MKLQPTRKALIIRWFLLLVIIISVIFMYWWKVRSNVVIRQEEKRLDGILNQINELYIANADIQTQWEELEQQQTQLHNSAEENREKIDELREEYDNSKLFLTAWQEK